MPNLYYNQVSIFLNKENPVIQLLDNYPVPLFEKEGLGAMPLS